MARRFFSISVSIRIIIWKRTSSQHHSETVPYVFGVVHKWRQTIMDIFWHPLPPHKTVTSFMDDHFVDWASQFRTIMKKMYRFKIQFRNYTDATQVGASSVPFSDIKSELISYGLIEKWRVRWRQKYRSNRCRLPKGGRVTSETPKLTLGAVGSHWENLSGRCTRNTNILGTCRPELGNILHFQN